MTLERDREIDRYRAIERERERERERARERHTHTHTHTHIPLGPVGGCENMTEIRHLVMVLGSEYF